MCLFPKAHACPPLTPQRSGSGPHVVQQMPSPGSGHGLEKAQCLGGGCWESLIHPDWHSCGTSAGGLHHLQTGDRTAGVVSKLHCTKTALVPAQPSAGRALAGAPVSALHQHICTTPALLPTGPACFELQLKAPDAAAERIWSSILQGIQQISCGRERQVPRGFAVPGKEITIKFRLLATQ